MLFTIKSAKFAIMANEKFYSEVKLMFENYLSPKKDRLQLRVRDIAKDSILSEKNMNYAKVLFDADLNIYKIDNEGKLLKVENDNFETVVMREQ